MPTTVTFAGNLAEAPELHWTRHNKPFSCRVLVNRRVQNDQGEWLNHEPNGPQREGLRLGRHACTRQLRIW